jgi:hypothetical protein
MLMKKRLIAVAATAATLALVIGAAFAVADPPTLWGGNEVTVEPIPAERFQLPVAVLNAPRSAGADAAIAKLFPGNAAAAHGYDIDTARVIGDPASDPTLVAIPQYALTDRDKTVCLLAFGQRNPGVAAGGCSDAEEFPSKGMIALVTTDNQPSLAALVPDGVDSIDIEYRDGPSKTVPVTNNAALLALDKADVVTAATIETKAGPATTQLRSR